jgi:hypothetical protein
MLDVVSVTAEGADTDSIAKKSVSSQRSKSHLLAHISAELLDIKEQLHPMLAVIFIDCPHTFTIDIFGRFILWCVKVLRRTGHQDHYLLEGALLTGGSSIVAAKGATVELGLDEEDAATATASKERQQDEDIRNTSKFVSGVTRIMCKLLLLAESYQPVDILHKRNYEVLMDTLRSFVLLGKEEENVLLKLGGEFTVFLFSNHVTSLCADLLFVAC